MQPQEPILWGLLAWEEVLTHLQRGSSLELALGHALDWLNCNGKANGFQLRQLITRLRQMGYPARTARRLVKRAFQPIEEARSA